jgi:hypothetical protein
MVKFIAHRGNTVGPQPDFENTQDYMLHALSENCGVEVDVILHQGKLYYGHDEPGEPADIFLLSHPEVVCHAKTLDTLAALLKLQLHCFWHQADHATLTSRGFIWCYPGYHPVSEKSIWLDLHDKPLPADFSEIYAICGDDMKVIKND